MNEIDTAPCGSEGWQVGLWEGLQTLVSNVEHKASYEGESPIERMFVAACHLFNITHYPMFDFGHLRPPESHKWYFAYVFTQARIENFRVDFLIMGTGLYDGVSIVVECDGHAFHERTPEQASRDRQRDRRLQTLGYSVLRFTGSELYKRSFACVCEVARLMIEKSSYRDNTIFKHQARMLDEIIDEAAERVRKAS